MTGSHVPEFGMLLSLRGFPGRLAARRCRCFIDSGHTVCFVYSLCYLAVIVAVVAAAPFFDTFPRSRAPRVCSTFARDSIPHCDATWHATRRFELCRGSLDRLPIFFAPLGFFSQGVDTLFWGCLVTYRKCVQHPYSLGIIGR